VAVRLRGDEFLRPSAMLTLALVASFGLSAAPDRPIAAEEDRNCGAGSLRELREGCAESYGPDARSQDPGGGAASNGSDGAPRLEFDVDNLGAVDVAMAGLVLFGAHWDPMIVPSLLPLNDEDFVPLRFESQGSRQRALDCNQTAIVKLAEFGAHVEQKFSQGRTALATTVNLQWPMDKSFRFSDSPIGDILHIRRLIVTGVEVNDADAAVIGKMQELQLLSLSSRHLTDAGLAQLQKLNQLRRLDLTAAKVSAKGVLDLVDKLPNLKDLGLHASLIGMRPSDVKELRSRHPGLRLRLR